MCIRDRWDDVVELSYTAERGGASLAGAPHTVWPRDEGTTTFPWPGPVRARVHARGQGTGGPEKFRIQLWTTDPDAATGSITYTRRTRPPEPSLPWTTGTPLVRTDFTHPDAWTALATAVSTPDSNGISPNLDLVDDADYTDTSLERLLELATDHWRSQHHLPVSYTHLTLPTNREV